MNVNIHGAGDSCRLAMLILAATALLGALESHASAATSWLSGGKLQEQLQRPIDIIKSGSPLRSVLSGLSRQQRVAVLIDRRIDPSQKLELAFGGVPLRDALEQIAGSRDLGVSLLGPVVYFGPAEVASQLRTLATLRREAIRKLPPDVTRRFFRTKRIAWPDFATPRGLIEKLAADSRLEIVGLELVPHDLWAAADLPAIALIDRFTLILIQFDLTFHVTPDGRQIGLLAVPSDLTLVRSYPGGAKPADRAEGFAALAPDARITVVGSNVQVEGLLEDHERITASRQTQGRRAAQVVESLTDKRFTLTVKNKPVRVVLAQLASSLNLEIKIDHDALEKAGISLEQLVSLSVKEATIDELLEAVIQDTPLRYRRRNNMVEIGPLKKRE